MDEIKLKPCPFCGGKPRVLKGIGGKPIKKAYTVACETERCFLEGGGNLYTSEFSAIMAWNRRANDG